MSPDMSSEWAVMFSSIRVDVSLEVHPIASWVLDHDDDRSLSSALLYLGSRVACSLLSRACVSSTFAPEGTVRVGLHTCPQFGPPFAYDGHPVSHRSLSSFAPVDSNWFCLRYRR